MGLSLSLLLSAWKEVVTNQFFSFNTELKVVVRCKCLTLKKEWVCQDVQAAHRDTGSDPKDVSKNQFGVGLLPCGSTCKRKIQMAEAVLQKCNVKEIEEKEEPVLQVEVNDCLGFADMAIGTSEEASTLVAAQIHCSCITKESWRQC